MKRLLIALLVAVPFAAHADEDADRRASFEAAMAGYMAEQAAAKAELLNNTWERRESRSLLEQRPEFMPSDSWVLVPWYRSNAKDADSTHTTGVYLYQADIDSTFKLDIHATCSGPCSSAEDVHRISRNLSFESGRNMHEMISMKIVGGVGDGEEFAIDDVQRARPSADDPERTVIEMSDISWDLIDALDIGDWLELLFTVDGGDDSAKLRVNLKPGDEYGGGRYSSIGFKMEEEIRRAGLASFVMVREMDRQWTAFNELNRHAWPVTPEELAEMARTAGLSVEEAANESYSSLKSKVSSAELDASLKMLKEATLDAQMNAERNSTLINDFAWPERLDCRRPDPFQQFTSQEQLDAFNVVVTAFADCLNEEQQNDNEAFFGLIRAMGGTASIEQGWAVKQLVIDACDCGVLLAALDEMYQSRISRQGERWQALANDIAEKAAE